jgi:hypothetical protein
MAERISVMTRCRELPAGEPRAANDPASAEPLSAERRRVRDRISWLCRHAGDGRANGLLRTVVEQYRMAGLP